jgi:dienelactone hydrolase
MCTPPDEYEGPRPAAAQSEAENRLLPDDGAELREFLATPSSGLANGAVVVIHDIWGYTDFYKDLARRIAAAGHAAAVPDFFGRQGDLPESMRAPERTAGRSPGRWPRPWSERTL